jgi:hypothetical protein
MIEIINLIVLIGIWSCIGVIYKNSKKNTKVFEEIVKKLEELKIK